MKFRIISGLGAKIVPLLSACFLCFGVACSSSGDGSDPAAEVTEENAAANGNTEGESANNANNSDPLANNENGAGGNLDNVNNANLNVGEAAEGDGNNVAALAEGNAAGAELQGAVAENPAGAANDPLAVGENQANVGEQNLAAAPAGEDPFAATAQNAGPVNGANPAADPFAAAPANTAVAVENTPPANTEVPVNSAPVEAASGGSGGESAPAGGAVTSGSSIAGVVVPEMGARLAYNVQRGDTLSIIAKKIYSQMGKWKELASSNKILNANKIYAGDVIYYTLDQSSKAFAESYEGAARSSVTVATGDSLSSIASKVLGSSAAWRSLWKENPQVKNPHLIRVGQVLSFRSQGGTSNETAKSSEPASEEVESDEVAASE